MKTILPGAALALALLVAGCNGASPNSSGAVAAASTGTTPAAAPGSSTPMLDGVADISSKEAVAALVDALGLDASRREAVVAKTLIAFAEARAEIVQRGLERGQALDEDEVEAVLAKKQAELDAQIFGTQGGGQ